MKIWIAVLFVTLLVTNGYWIYKTIDNSVTLFYMEDSVQFTARTLKEAIRVANLNVIGLNADEVIELLKMDAIGSNPFEKEECIYTDRICLVLDSDRVVTGIK